MLAGLLALSLILMKLYPNTPLAQSLHLWLVERPLEWAGKLERKHVILVAIILFSGPSLAAFGSTEIAMIYAADLSIYADAVLMTSLTAVAASLKNGWRGLVRGVVCRLPGRQPRRRSRRVPAAQREAGSPSNDDEPVWARFAA